MSSDLAEIIQQINASGGLPIQMTYETNWTQFGMLLMVSLIGSFFIIYMVMSMMKSSFSGIFAYFKLRKISKILEKNILFIKHTDVDLFNSSMIDGKTMLNIEKALKKFNGKPFDLIIHSPGGIIFYSQMLSKILSEYKGRIRAIVPYYAMSGGTLLALSCDEILMSDISCLGPIDPQIGMFFSYGSAKSWDYVIKRKGRKADDTSYRMAFMGEQHTKSIQLTLESILIDKIKDKELRNKTIDYLTNGNIEHSRQLLRSDLKILGIETYPLYLKVKEILTDMITSRTYEGVYYYVRKDKK